AATLTGPVSVPVNQFNDGICGLARACIPEPSPASSGDYLDSLGDRLMFRLAYRNYGDHQAMVVNQTVGTSGGGGPSNPPAGIRWYEIDAPAGATSTSTFTIAQQGTYMPGDGTSRWMGSIAMDHVGDIGLGYSMSSTSLDPSAGFTGQTVGAASGVLDAGETMFVTGTGVQQGTGNRWGDYSATVVDPVDDCTFWTSQEYISATGQYNWSTALAAFKFDNCSLGPIGTVSGTVTAAASGSAIAGATVTLTPGDYVATTGPNGTYSATVPATSTGPMSYTAVAAAFGYTTSPSTPVSIIQNTTTTQDFSLATAPSAAISGTVTDGSGHGYPLYAEVKVSTPSYGQVADLWTAPSTGDYSVSLPAGLEYTVEATAHENGYTPAVASLTLATAGSTQDFGLTVGSSCSAPGYGFVQGFGQDFNGSTFPPTGWTVVNAPPGTTVAWEQSSSEPAPYNVNYTGGTGAAADADSNAAGSGSGPYDTSLVSPPIPVTSLPANPVLKYKANYIPLGGDALDLDYSTDGGTTWTTISHWTTAHGTLYALPGVNVQVPVGSYVPATGSIQFRWRYYSPGTSYNWYAQVDDVSIGTCAPIAGGLTEGSITNANGGSPLIGATVTDDTGSSAVTFANPADPNLANGLYILFSPAGDRTLTATDGLFSPGTASVTVANNGLLQQNFALDSAQFTANPASFNVHVTVGETLTKTLTIANTGNGSGVFKILAIDAPPPGTGPVMMGRGAPLHNIHGHFSPASLHSLAMRGLNAEAQAGNTQTLASAPGTAWSAVAPYPIPVLDTCGTSDPTTGKVYSFTGISGGSDTASDFMFDPASGTWSPIANYPSAGVEKPACAYLGGKIYVTDGWDSGGNNSATLDIYHPSSDSWTTGADNPNSQGGAAVAVALNGKLYVIGGCLNGSSCPGSNAVEVYDPASDSWSAAANYPSPVAWTNCGAIAGKIYCAGGTISSSAETGNGYVYDPNTDSWTAIAPMPYDIFGAVSIATAAGKLLVQDGVTASFATITNQGVIYDPSTDSWSPLPNNIVTTYRSGGGCGFYQWGGQDGSFTGLTSAEVLPGYTGCGMAKIPWLTVSPTDATLAAGATADVTLTFDGTGQKEFTTSQAYLEVTGSPYPNVNVPLTVTWDPHPINLAISGSVSPTGTVKAGDNLAYTLVVQNIQSTGSGSATQTTMTYKVPAGVTYLASNGDATSCTAASGTVTCDFGTLAQGASALEIIVVQANQDANTVDSTFTISAREPDSDMSNNTADISTNPNTGPPGPAGPPGPQGSKGSSGFGWLGLMGLLGLALVGEWSRRRRYQARR
ncbi:MAG: choice-of-anchor J domain-containing protein, partial [Gammaproteobacteria bacterium]